MARVYERWSTLAPAGDDPAGQWSEYDGVGGWRPPVECILAAMDVPCEGNA